MIDKQLALGFRTIVVLSFCQYTVPSHAEDMAAQLSKCKKIEAAKQRLECYDTLGGKTQSNSETSQQSGECAIEAWNYTEKAGSIFINGSTTCATGKLTYRLYNGGSGEFIASDFTFIEGYAFQSYTDGKVPAKLQIKYTIESK
jgi:hypothetical protein